MLGFPPKNVEAIRSGHVVCVIKVGDLRVKAFQVIFREDGSLFINFPYFRHRIGLLSAASLSPNGERKSDVNLEQAGKVTSNLVKYSHHPDGRAHFSQDGKILTAVKRQSTPLDKHNGHIFSLLIQGLSALKKADPIKDALTSTKRAIIEFAIEPPEAIKIVGRWFDVTKLRCSNPGANIGPVVPTLDPDGASTSAIFVASPYLDARHVLAISCVPIPILEPAQEVFVFYGGFDPPELMTDATKEAGFLAFLYPVSEAERIKERVGSVDYISGS